MKKLIVKVPKGIRYISQWGDYAMPTGHCIVDKGVTGCGYTEMCLTNEHNVVLCSPRKMLLTNKAEQHLNDSNIYYYENDFKDVSDLEAANEILNELTMRSMFGGIPFKFMVTYDSFHYIKEFLEKRGSLSRTYIVVDEMQAMFGDIFMKADVENNFLSVLQDCPNVLYLSATPLMDDYLDQIDEFKNLPMYYLDWSETGFVEPLNIQRLRVTSIYKAAKDYIEAYREGDFPILVINGKVRRSKEAVFFLNSITDIVRIINSCELKPSEVNILCSNTETNKSKLRKVGHKIGKIPLKGEPNKMFTFCTSTVYVGADFYSDCASTYIFSDPNVNSLAVDIAIDFPQIVGRQRSEENCFKNYVTIIYKTTREGNIVSREEFDEVQERRRINSQKILDIWNKVSADEQEVFLYKIRDSINYSAYEKDFISIKGGSLPVFNKLIELANERAWKVVQEDYQDVVNVTKALDNYSNTSSNELKTEDERLVSEFLEKEFYSTGNFQIKLKSFCEFMDRYRDNRPIIELLRRRVDPRFNNFYVLFGTKGCMAMKFRENLLMERIHELDVEDILKNKITRSFLVGTRYTRKFMKDRLGEIYLELDIKRKPKATDVESWLEIKPVLMIDSSGSKDHGFEILSVR